MSKNATHLVVDETEVAATAAREMRLPFKAGEVIPSDFPNPEKGDLGHYCMDREGRYQPSWYCLMLHKYDDRLPSRQFFNDNTETYFVKVGTWVDVPPAVFQVLRGCVIETTSMDYDNTDLVTNDFVPAVVETQPRFAYTILPSAR